MEPTLVALVAFLGIGLLVAGAAWLTGVCLDHARQLHRDRVNTRELGLRTRRPR